MKWKSDADGALMERYFLEISIVTFGKSRKILKKKIAISPDPIRIVLPNDINLSPILNLKTVRFRCNIYAFYLLLLKIFIQISKHQYFMWKNEFFNFV